jgi:hypothetical protein
MVVHAASTFFNSLHVTLKMETEWTSEMLVSYHIIASIAVKATTLIEATFSS